MSKKNLIELFKDIYSITIPDLLLPCSGRDVDYPVSVDLYIKKSCDTFVKPIMVGVSIDATFTNLVAANRMLPHKKLQLGYRS